MALRSSNPEVFHMKWILLSAVLAAAALGPSSGAVLAASAVLETHRALYTLSLSRAETSSGIQSADGLLSVELSGGCEGYVFNEHHLMDVAYSEGGRARMDFRISTWESGDGDTLRFDRKSVIDGEVAEHFRGRAELDAEGGGGRVVFADPEHDGLSPFGENVVREIGLANGLVDVKVIALDDVWSGLKFVRRVKDRT